MGPVTFVERQIAHVWASSMAAIAGLFFVELWLGLPALTLSPVLPLIAGMVFVIKAGILSGTFYLQAVALFATSPLMAWFPEVGHLIFGTVSAACFFFPGLKYYRQRIAGGAT
jgi:serine/threonine-protein kinase